MEITFRIYNPLNTIKLWFLYNKVFWKIYELEVDRLGFYDIDRKKYHIYFIKHIITRRIISYDGWGDKLLQHAIYQVNKEYDLFEESSDKYYEKKRNKIAS